MPNDEFPNVEGRVLLETVDEVWRELFYSSSHFIRHSEILKSSFPSYARRHPTVERELHFRRKHLNHREAHAGTAEGIQRTISCLLTDG